MEICERWRAGLKALSIETFDEEAIEREAQRITDPRALAKWILARQKFWIGTPAREVKAFAETLARAKIRRAQSARIIAECLDHGHDLVEIPETLNPCEKCRRFLGRIFSITGDTQGYPKLGEVPPFHPGCVHYLRWATLPINSATREKI